MNEVVEGAVEVKTGELERVRAVILEAHPDVVAELVAGDSVASLLDSVEPARAAYAAVREQIVGEAVAVAPPVVPAGAGSGVLDPAELPAHELIRRGINEAARRR